MTLIKQVVAVLENAGRPCSTDEIFAQTKGKSRRQVQDALKNARQLNLAHVHRREWMYRASVAYWVAGGTQKEEPLPVQTGPRGDYGIPRVTSVWQLGASQ